MNEYMREKEKLFLAAEFQFINIEGMMENRYMTNTPATVVPGKNYPRALK